jgi:hypothetical protein
MESENTDFDMAFLVHFFVPGFVRASHITAGCLNFWHQNHFNMFISVNAAIRHYSFLLFMKKSLSIMYTNSDDHKFLQAKTDLIKCGIKNFVVGGSDGCGIDENGCIPEKEQPRSKIP